MSADNQTIKGNHLEIEVDVPLEFVTLKCEAQNIISKKIVRVSKTVQVKGRSTQKIIVQYMALYMFECSYFSLFLVFRACDVFTIQPVHSS